MVLQALDDDNYVRNLPIHEIDDIPEINGTIEIQGKKYKVVDKIWLVNNLDSPPILIVEDWYGMAESDNKIREKVYKMFEENDVITFSLNIRAGENTVYVSHQVDIGTSMHYSGTSRGELIDSLIHNITAHLRDKLSHDIFDS